MHTRTVRGGRLCGLAMVMALVLVVVPAAPTAADHSPPPPSPVAGSGTLQGTELYQEEVFLGQPCFAATRHTYGLRGEGTYHGRTAGGQAVVYRAQLGPGQPLHEGPIHIEFRNSEPFHHGPGGTHGSDSSCSPPTAGTPVPVEVRICAPRPLEYVEFGQPEAECVPADHVYKIAAGGAHAPCTGRGSFVREGMNDDPNWHADWTLDEACVVVGNDAGTPGQGVAPAGTVHTHRGLHRPCSGICYDNFKVDFAQHLPEPGLAVSMGGPTSAPIGQTVTLTAGVTDDGVPVSGAPVAFSVAGPGPAAPAAATIPTGVDGRAGFTFTAGVAGDYVVTASTTWPTHPGQVVSDTHAVRFTVPAPAMTLAGLTRSVIEDPVTVTATIVDENNPVPGDPQHDPVPGVIVNFTVTDDGAGQATPASGTATTDYAGRATFNFVGDRAGGYTVAAAAAYVGEEVSATHTVRLDVKTLSREGAVDFTDNEAKLTAAVIDPAGRYAYFGVYRSPGQVLKVDLNTFERVGVLTLNSGENSLASAVIDPAGRYAYFGTGSSTGLQKVVKVDLATFQRVGALTLGVGEIRLTAAVIDPAGNYAYFGTDTSPARVVKIDLTTFERVGALSLADGEDRLSSAVIDPAGNYAYFGTQKGSSERVVKVGLEDFQRKAAITLGSGESLLTSAVIDPEGESAYFGTTKRLIKFDLANFERVGAVDLPGNVGAPTSAVIDPAGAFAYFGAPINDSTDIFRYGFLPAPQDVVPTPLVYNLPTSDGVVKVDLRSFEVAQVLPLAGGEEGLTSAVIAPDGAHAYFGTSPFGDQSRVENDDFPARMVKVSLTRPPKAALAASNDAYSTPYLTALTAAAPGVLANDIDTADGDALTAHHATDPSGGSVTLNRDGSFTYTPDAGFGGTDTFTYLASDGMDYSAPATVSVTVAAPPQGVQAVSGGAFGFETNVSLFGGPATVKGGSSSTCGQTGQPACADGQSPAANLPPSGGDLSASDPDGNVGQYGPAKIFENHGPLTVRTQGATGPAGAVLSSALVKNIQDNDPFHAGAPDGEASSTCTATGTTLGGSTRIVNGRLVTSTHPTTGEPTNEITFPHDWSPAPNTEYRGTLNHVGDSWRIVFNEQILSPEAITVNAVHMYLLGPTAVGDMIIGQSRCGVVTSAANAAPVGNDDAYAATAGRPLVVPAAAVLANDTDADGQPLTAAKPPGTRPPASGGGTWTFPGEPAHGTLDLRIDGSFTYTPAPGYSGPDSFTYLAQDSRGKSDPATVSLTVAPASRKAVADFDGNGSTDLSVFRPNSGTWYLQGSAQANFGVSGDIAVPADYDGDGKADVAVFRPSNGVWYVKGSAGTDTAVAFGASGDIPVPADYDGDGKADIAVFRTGVWYVKGSAGVDTAAAFGAGGDVPVPADYDGDAKADRAVFRSGVWYVKGSAGTDSAVAFGTSGDVPVPGDYDGNGTAEVAVFRPAAGVWFVQGGATTAFGTNGDVPVPGDYDGDGDIEIAVFRPSAGVWFVQGGATTAWGTSGDVPLPLPAAVFRSMG